MDLREARQAVGKQSRSNVLDNDYFAFGGGLNVVETPMQTNPGELLGVLNYEPNPLGGYKRFQGYERFDGARKPSLANYYVITFANGTPGFYPGVNSIVSGLSSGSSATSLLAAPVLTSPNAGYIVVTGNGIATDTAAGFLVGEQLSVRGGVMGTVVSSIMNGGSTATLNSQYGALAQAVSRASVRKVGVGGGGPGASGPILGVVTYKGTTYAFVNSFNGLQATMWKSDPQLGWRNVPMCPHVPFDTGTIQINPGDNVVGGTSGATGKVLRVVLQSGDFAAGTAQGYFVTAAILVNAPTFVNNEQIKVGGVQVALCAANQFVPNLAPGGTYEFRITNFFGAYQSTRLYGVDGLNNAFEYQSGTAGVDEFFCQIQTGMTIDAPYHIAAHRGRLWLAYPGGSLQPSGVNDPDNWSALNGAAELGVGSEITGILEEMSPSQSAFYSTSTMFIFSPQQINTITGDGPNWILGPFATEIGAGAFSMQRIGQGVFLSDRGFCTLNAVQQLGNFALATFSQKIQTLIGEIVSKAAFATVSRNRSLYRLHMNDGTMVSIGFKDLKVTGHTLCDLGLAFTCGWSGENSDSAQAAEMIVLGGPDGYVYQLDSGNNMDGNQLNAFMQLPFHFSKSPMRQKRYRFARLDLVTQGPTSIVVEPNYSFADPSVGSDVERTLTLAGSGGFYDVSTWDSFNYDSAYNQAPTFKLEGSGTNMGLLISHSSANDPPHTIQGLTLVKSMRRLDRSSIG